MTKLVLGYWDIRGLAEPARMMLEYGRIEHEDKRYKCGRAPSYDLSEWTDVKYKLDLDFPNLPYLIDGNLRITESRAIYRYIAKKIGIEPKTIDAQAVCDMLEGVVDELRDGFTSPLYYPDYESKKAGIKESQTAKLKQFEKYLQRRQFLTGDSITSVDFSFYETLDHHRLFFPDILDKFSNIKGFIERFESLDRITAYLKSDRFKRTPVNNPPAYWEGKCK